MSKATKKNNTYPSEFKESAVTLALESNRPIAQTARELGINSNTLYSWIDKLSGSEKTKPVDEHLYEENKRLKRELAKITQERDLLKKATAYFAKEIS